MIGNCFRLTPKTARKRRSPNWSGSTPTGFSPWPSEYDSYGKPKDLTGNAQERRKLEFKDTEAGRTWSRIQSLYDFNVGADGSFTIPEVLEHARPGRGQSAPSPGGWAPRRVTEQ
jgi:hypothetical protein